MRPFLTLHDPARARDYYDRGLWCDDTFYSLLAFHAKNRPDAPALRDGTSTLSWIELEAQVNALAADLESLGLATGDRVSLWLSNRCEGVVAFLACSRQGYACNPSLHRTYTCAEVVALLRRLDARALVTEPGWGADRDACDLDSLLSGVEALRKVYSAEALPEAGPAPDSLPVSNPDKVAYLAFTSGTTGEPKCVMHSDNTLMANPRDMVRDWGVNLDTRLLTLSPISHHIAWVAVGQWLLSGCRLLLDDPPRG